MNLAIFDLDNTLINTDSDHAWGEFLIKIGAVDESSYRKTNDRFYQDYVEGCLNINAYLEFALQPLTQHKMEQLKLWHDQFMREIIEPAILPKAKNLLKQHQLQNDYLLIITATNDFITRPIAKKLGVDDIIASQAEIINQQYTGKVTGVPCYREGKVSKLQDWMAETGVPLGLSMDNSFFYSDSHSDIPLLEQVNSPVAVDPDETLRRHANDNNWQVISLR